MAAILVLHGANINLLGIREPSLYGNMQLEQINAQLVHYAEQAGHQLQCAQYNAEHQLLEAIHRAYQHADFIIINAGAFTHTSLALRDALLAVAIPFIEVHLSNPHARETFRQHSYLADIATGIISGLGVQSYQLAVEAAIYQLETQ